MMQEAILIDAGNIIAWLNVQIEKARRGDLPIDATAYYGDAVTFVKNLPKIGAEPVIHCKDCAFWESKRISCEGLARCRTGESGYRCRFGYDFCSRAQRREEVSEDAGSKTD